MSSKFRAYVLASIGISVGGWLAETCSPPPAPPPGSVATNLLDDAKKKAKEDTDLWNQN